jgi:hypothetical protein
MMEDDREDDAASEAFFLRELPEQADKADIKTTATAKDEEADRFMTFS